MSKFTLEVCADSVESVLAAEKGGADRIELCGNVVIGGTTPSESLFREIRRHSDIKIHALIRPRFGDFCYTEYEFDIIRSEVRRFRELGAQGVVIGMLKPDGSLDVEHLALLMEEAKGMSVTLHRAFDVCRDPFEALEQCRKLGINTILTSGQRASAWEGRFLLAELIKKAEGKIEILAGAGIGPETIPDLAAFTGVRSFHMSGKTVKESRMLFRREGVPMGLPGFDEYKIWQTDEANVRAASHILSHLTESG